MRPDERTRANSSQVENNMLVLEGSSPTDLNALSQGRCRRSNIVSKRLAASVLPCSLLLGSPRSAPESPGRQLIDCTAPAKKTCIQLRKNTASLRKARKHDCSLPMLASESSWDLRRAPKSGRHQPTKVRTAHSFPLAPGAQVGEAIRSPWGAVLCCLAACLAAMESAG